MRSEILNSSRIADSVEWPPTKTEPTAALQKSRRILVRILTDRLNREEITFENEKALREAMADINDFYNPSGITGFVRYNKTLRIRESSTNKVIITGPKREVSAVLKALSKEIGKEIKSIADL